MNKTIYTPGDLVDHVAVSAVIKNSERKILMFKHKKFGFWTIPIGKAEAGETAYQGMCNEVKEECGIEVVSATELATKAYTYERNDIPVNLIHHLFIVDEYRGTIINNEPEKHLEMKFLTESEIRGLADLSDATLLYLEQIA